MKQTIGTITMAAALVLLVGGTAMALSEELRSPRINFVKGYDQQRMDAVQGVLANKNYHYRNGMISYWPPDWSTTLVYEGDTENLNAFMTELRQVKGMHVKLTFSKDLAKETGSALSAGSWFVKYKQTDPDTITVRVNLAAKEIDLAALELPLAGEKGNNN
jgi:hypothetical protein